MRRCKFFTNGASSGGLPYLPSAMTIFVSETAGFVEVVVASISMVAVWLFAVRGWCVYVGLS